MSFEFDCLADQSCTVSMVDSPGHRKGEWLGCDSDVDIVLGLPAYLEARRIYLASKMVTDEVRQCVECDDPLNAEAATSMQ